MTAAWLSGCTAAAGIVVLCTYADLMSDLQGNPQLTAKWWGRLNGMQAGLWGTSAALTVAAFFTVAIYHLTLDRSNNSRCDGLVLDTTLFMFTVTAALWAPATRAGAPWDKKLSGLAATFATAAVSIVMLCIATTALDPPWWAIVAYTMLVVHHTVLDFGVWGVYTYYCATGAPAASLL